MEKCLPTKQRQDDGHFGKFKELVVDLWKKARVQRMPGGSSSSDDSYLISRETSALDYSDDDYLDDYSDLDDSSYAATLSWQPSEEEDFSSDEWIEGKHGFQDQSILICSNSCMLNNNANTFIRNGVTQSESERNLSIHVIPFQSRTHLIPFLKGNCCPEWKGTIHFLCPRKIFMFGSTIDYYFRSCFI